MDRQTHEVPWLQRLAANERHQWWVLFLYTLVSRLPLLTYPKACDDEQVYAVVAIEMLHGGLPYIDAIERKPPLLFYVYHAILKIAGDYNYYAIHLVGLVWLLTTLAFVSLIARRLFGSFAGFIAALSYSVFSAWGDYSNLAFNGEVLMNLPVVAALALTFRRTHARLRMELIVAGALIAVAFLLKQPSVVAGLALAIHVLHPDYRRARRLDGLGALVHASLLLFGLACALALNAYWLYRLGILREAWYWTVGNHANPLGPTTWFFWHKLPLIGTWFLAESLPLLILAGWSIWAGFKRESPWLEQRAEFVALVVLLLTSSYGVAYNGQFNFHYFLQLMPALALLAAPLAAELLSGRRRPPLPVLSPRSLSVWVGLTALLFLLVDAIGLSRNRGPHEAAVYVSHRSQPTDRIFMWGQGTQQTGLYLDSQRRPASRYIASFPLNGLIFGLLDKNHDTSYRIVPGSWENLRADFERHPPRFIIDCHAIRDGDFYRIIDYPYLRELLSTEYRLVHRAIDGVIYERIDSNRASQKDRLADRGS
jgi:4-amino-4-deoxy-L-arabinose transferase-like glycosyltransferase